MPRRSSFLLYLFLIPVTVAAQVTVQEYSVPRGHRVHDVWADSAPDGPVWISVQGSGHLGILDPKSGKFDFVPLGPGSAPHGVIAGADGAPWLTDGGQNAIVRVDPKTKQVKVWKLPQDSGYANLNTAIFDGKGLHWFTGQSGIYGRLDPASGEMRVFKAPKGRGPYGIHATPDGTVYYASLAGSFVGKINTDGSTTVLEPPTRVRLMQAVLRRFFRAVTIAIGVTLLSGAAMLGLAWRDRASAGLPFNMPLDWYAMVGLFFAMLAVFAHIRMKLFRRLAAAVDAARWPDGASTLRAIRWEVTLNLVLGAFIVCIVRLGGTA
jgi:uncharacterized membrane protein